MAHPIHRVSVHDQLLTTNSIDRDLMVVCNAQNQMWLFYLKASTERNAFAIIPAAVTLVVLCFSN